jgi:hypothetical protein
MSLINVEAKAEKVKVEVPILGRRSKGNKTVGLKYSGSATMHYNTSIFRKQVLEYKRTGKDAYIEMVITNEDNTTDLGRQTTTLLGVNLDSVILAKFDADSDDYLNEDFDFTFEDFEMPEEFNELQGMS